MGGFGFAAARPCLRKAAFPSLCLPNSGEGFLLCVQTAHSLCFFFCKRKNLVPVQTAHSLGVARCARQMALQGRRVTAFVDRVCKACKAFCKLLQREALPL